MGEPPADLLFGWAWSDAEHALGMAQEYYYEAQKHGVPMPSDVEGDLNETDDIELFRVDFVAFFAAWRETVLKVLEEGASSRLEACD